MELKGSYASHQEAVTAANKLKGNEAISKDADGKFSVHSLSAEEMKSVNKADFSQFTADIVSFSIDKPKGADKVIDRVSGHQYKRLEDARAAAAAHAGHEAIARNDNGTLSIFPFVEVDKAVGAARGNFSKFAANTIEVALAKPEGEKVVEAIDVKATELVQNAQTLMDNIHANQAKLTKKSKEKPNQYVLGGQKVDIAAGKVAADCSGFLKAMYEKVGVEFGPRTAEDIGRMVRSGKGPFRQIKHGADIRPGDILSFSLPERTEITGHAMMAVGNPEPFYSPKTNKLIGYNIRIMDSTSRAHGDDTDHGKGKSGAGMGTITVGVDANDRITSLSWGKNFEMYDYKHEVTVGRLK